MCEHVCVGVCVCEFSIAAVHLCVCVCVYSCIYYHFGVYVSACV